VTPGVSIPALRAKAELTLADLMRDSARFEAVARECSNCPSAEDGGSLGELSRGDTVDEFERALFNGAYIGIYPQIVKTRYGFHIVAVDRRQAGQLVPYEPVRASIASRLSDHAQRAVLVRYVRKLAETAEVHGVDLFGPAATDEAMQSGGC
jgi:peptidyl-prolyl cis-trans isomerase C